MAPVHLWVMPGGDVLARILGIAAKDVVALDLLRLQELHALAHYAAPLPAKALRRRVDNVASQASALVSAVDTVSSGI